jgi:hypothetical protein
VEILKEFQNILLLWQNIIVHTDHKKCYTKIYLSNHPGKNALRKQ